MAIREATFEVGLQFYGAAADVPGAVRKLRIQQKGFAPLPGGGGRSQVAGFDEGDHGGRGAVGIGFEPRGLSPAAILALRGAEALCGVFKDRFRRIRKPQSEQAIGLFYRIDGRRLQEATPERG